MQKLNLSCKYFHIGIVIVTICWLLVCIGSYSGVFYDRFCSSFNNCRECTLQGSKYCRWNVLNKLCEGKSFVSLYGVCELKKFSECGMKVDPVNSYNDTFVRLLIFPLAVAANGEKPEICLKNTIDDVVLVKKVTVPSMNNWTTSSAYIAFTNQHKAIIIGFQGTSSPIQFLAHFYYGIFHLVLLKNGGKVSGYYFYLFKELWKAGLSYNVRHTLDKYPNYKIWVTGHSMGGTLAVLCAHAIVEKLGVEVFKIRLITFGEPRVFDARFSEIHDKMFPYSYRVVSFRDPIPHVPFLNFMNYRHHRYEVWYDNLMKINASYRIGLSTEDCSCSNSLLFYFSLDHVKYFNVHFNKFLDGGCKY